MILSLENTKQKLRSDNTPYWNLYYHKGYNNIVPIANYNDKDIDASIKYLQTNIDFCTNSDQNSPIRFVIKSRGTATSNGDKINEWDFTYSGKATAEPIQPNFNGFSGIPGLGAFPDVKNTFDEIEKRKDSLFDERAKIIENRTELQLEKFKFQTEKEYWEKEKKEFVQQLNELKKKYDSNSEAAKNGANIVLGEVLKLFISNNGKKGLLGILSGANETAQDTSKDNLTPEQEVINDIAIMIDEHKFDKPTLEGLKKFMEVYLDKIKKAESDKKEPEQNTEKEEQINA